jgi:hypothetical protein
MAHLFVTAARTGRRPRYRTVIVGGGCFTRMTWASQPVFTAS